MLDEMDIKILRLLQQDCTRPVADIGKEEVMADIQRWIDERLPASTSTATGA